MKKDPIENKLPYGQQPQSPTSTQRSGDNSNIKIPSIELPRGGGAIKGIEEKFQVNAVTGTSSFGIPIPVSPSRHGFNPSVGLTYNSGLGNGPFGLGWTVDIPSIKRNTERELPQYKDGEDADTFILSGSEDLVPFSEKPNQKKDNGKEYTVTRYRPRIEGLFARIERWQDNATGEVHWRTASKENIHSYYGITKESRISDPNDPSKVFEWLLCKTHDDKGNITIQVYKEEDFAGVQNKLSEKNRLNNCTQTYIKQILYGNKKPYYLGDAVPAEADFLFKIIFDYGEHDTAAAIPKDIYVPKNSWRCRKDPFSSYRSGFEIRTYRLCDRILVFHCFEESDLPHSPYLVRSLELFYDYDLELKGNGNKLEDFSYLIKARQNGHKWDDTSGHYLTKHLPDLDFTYQQHEWDTAIRAVTSENTVHAPVGIDARQYLWVDIFSEGISGILTEQATGWFYKSNLGNGDFSHAMPVAPKPSFMGLSSGRLSVQEIEANGIKTLVQLDREPKGFFKLTQDEEWEPFRSFSSLPNINLLDPNSRFIDLNGDGLADLLTTEDNVLRWYPGAGEKGFEISQAVTKEIDEEKGPAIVFADQNQSIFLADMSGDGLTDIVRIRNGGICYWPNLGYGRFGAKINMDNAPTFDHPDAFNPAYLRLADIDGSGTTDIIYLGKNDFRVWMNLSGNEWTTEPQIIPAFPQTSRPADISVLDFLGSGTACIVYSSPLPEYSQQPLQYIDLMGSKKPHLLIGYQNNCGGEVSLEYKTSTHFYLEDKKEGRKWITKLPFPVHCIAKVRSEDKIRETVFTNTYRYSHGYFDPYEREFRGFARVEQLDTEDFSQFKINNAKNVVEEDLHQPPVRTVSWFHTGAFLGKEKILHQCKSEYFNNGTFSEYDLPEPVVPDNLTIEETREALRACKGLPLRSEVYANDNSLQSGNPYSASQSSFEIRMIQPKGENKFASFLVIPSESISYGYERNPSDPRISHSFVLETDELGNVTKAISVVYHRVKRPVAPNDIPDRVWEEQSKSHIVYGETLFTKDIITDETYRLRAGYESKSYELSGIAIPAGSFITKKDLFDQIKAAGEISFEEDFTTGKQKRLSGHSRSYFLKDDLSVPLQLGKLSSLGIGHKGYRLAFTKDLVPKYFGSKVTNSMLEDAGYIHSEGDDDWWTQSGTAIYDPSPKNNFFTPVGVCDAFGNKSYAEYDKYILLVKSTTDAIGNKAAAVLDYRTLSPVMLIDPNLNRAAVETDELGLVVKSAVMGKEGAGEGDTLDDPTARMEYDLFNWQNNKKPNYVHTFAREQHGPANPRWQESYVYSDGGGNVIMTKAHAEPGKAKKWNAATKQVEDVDADPRWVGNGRTIINNKGNPVKQYEPYFSTTYEYESEDALVETGVTPILYYDSVGRNIRTEYPNGTFAKVEFDAWSSKSFDVNDTVKDSQWYADRGSPDPAGAEPADPEQRAAWLAAKHYDTPATAHTDSLGRTIYAITDYGNGKTTSVYSESDLTWRYARVYDQLGRCVSEAYTNLLGSAIYGKSAEKGERWIFTDVIGRMVKVWDNDVRELWSTFDELHRPVSTFVKEGGNEILFGHVVYGDILADAAQQNMKGRAYQLYDQAGLVRLKTVDFKGNVTEVERRLGKEYKKTVNWQVLDGLVSIDEINTKADSLLEGERFSSSSVLDALNRPTLVTLPDKSIVEPKYNEANLLNSLRVKIRGQGDYVTFLEDQDYDAKGQRQFAKYGNGLITNYFYDPKTFRLVNLITKKAGTADSQSHQNLNYTFDPVGNIVSLRDDAQQTNYFSNAVVKPESKFEYDAIYQLKTATGREHAGLGGNTQRDNNDLPFLAQLPHLNDLTAVRNYTEFYKYDDCGNISQLKHVADKANWNQNYRYEYQDDPNNKTNRLKSTSLPGDPDAGPYSAAYQHDLHGNMIKMPHLDELVWNFMDQLAMVNLGGGGFAFFVYGLGGRRIRKIVERQGGKKIDRIYLGAVEIYREYQGNKKKLERSTLHISDNTGRIAQVDTKLLDEDNSDPANPLNINFIRYQYTNHLGSATMETDEFGTVISYEEYHPYGTSAYRSAKSDVDLSLKRYRFSGKERDDETGFYYFGARYYAAWLGRWTSSDPAGLADGANLYRYSRNSPINYTDPLGLTPTLKSFNAEPLDINYSGTSEEVLEYYNRNPVVGTGTFVDDETGETTTAPMSVRVTARGVTIVTQGGGANAGREFWQITDFDFVPGSGRLLTNLSIEEVGESASSSARSSESPQPAEAPEPEPAETSTDLAPVPDAARTGLQEVARPSSVTGARPRGTLHLWSGTQGKADARAAIRSSGSGWMMGDIEGAPTPEHAAGEQEFARARARAPGGQLTQAEFERIWGPRSASVVGRGAFAGHPVEAHGNAAPTSIQARYEWPARAVGGGLGGGLFFGTGMFTAITGGQDPNPGVAVPLVLGGVGEATSGIMYAAGAFGGSAECMAIGAAGGTLFGGATAAIGFGVASARSFERGDTAGGVVNALGAVGGVLLIASLFTPVGWVALAGVGLVALAAGFNLGRWLSD